MVLHWNLDYDFWELRILVLVGGPSGKLNCVFNSGASDALHFTSASDTNGNGGPIFVRFSLQHFSPRKSCCESGHVPLPSGLTLGLFAV